MEPRWQRFPNVYLPPFELTGFYAGLLIFKVRDRADVLSVTLTSFAFALISILPFTPWQVMQTSIIGAYKYASSNMHKRTYTAHTEHKQGQDEISRQVASWWWHSNIFPHVQDQRTSMDANGIYLRELVKAQDLFAVVVAMATPLRHLLQLDGNVIFRKRRKQDEGRHAAHRRSWQNNRAFW